MCPSQCAVGTRQGANRMMPAWRPTLELRWLWNSRVIIPNHTIHRNDLRRLAAAETWRLEPLPRLQPDTRAGGRKGAHGSARFTRNSCTIIGGIACRQSSADRHLLLPSIWIIYCGG